MRTETEIIVLSGTDSYMGSNIDMWTALMTNVRLMLNVVNPNTTTAPTLSLDGLAARPFVRYDGSAVEVGLLTGLIEVMYNGTSFQIINSKSATYSPISYWPVVLGTPTRVGNTSFTITDTGNANLYDQLLSRTTVLKWVDVGVVKLGMVISAVYAANAVTVTIIGDVITATATMNSFKYALQKADIATFAIAGNIAVGNDLSVREIAECTVRIFGASAFHGTAGVTGVTTYNISLNKADGTVTLLTSPVSIASGATSSTVDQTTSDGTDIYVKDYLAVNCVAVSTVTAPIDAYIHVFMFTTKNILLN